MNKNRLLKSGLYLMDMLERKRITREKLTPHQRRLIVKYIMEEQSEWSNGEIGELIGCTDVHVCRLKAEEFVKECRRCLKQFHWSANRLTKVVDVLRASKKKTVP